MKKILILAITLLMLLTGCGDKNSTSDSKQEETVSGQKVMSLEDIYGTWTFSKVIYNGSTYTIKEIEATGDYSLSGVYFVFKEGGSGYMYASENDEGSFAYEYNEETNIITAGSIEFAIVGKELVMEVENGIVYLEKYSNSQDITEIPKKEIEEETEEVEQEEAEEVEQEEETVETNENEIRPEIKEAIDAYEIFIDEYCVFMEKYASSGGTDISLLTDYAKFVSKLADMESKMDKLEGDLTSAETLYYSEVMLRCSQKMLEVAY